MSAAGDSPSLFTDPQFSVQSTVGLDQNLAYSRVALQDSEFLSETATQFMPKAAQNVRNYRILTKDVQAITSSATVPFNSYTTFKFGNEGLPNLAFAELQVNLPRLTDVTSGVTRGNPADPGYAGAGGVGTFLNWQPYIAELITAGGSDPLRIKHSTETLRAYTALGIHIKRALCMDAYGTARRAAYNNSVGAIAQNTNYPLNFRIPVWLPHTTDDVNFHQLLPVQAFSTEFQLVLKTPQLVQCIQTDIATPSSNVVVDPAGVGSFANQTSTYDAQTAGAFTAFLRLGYIVTEKAERGTFANMLLHRDGLTYQTMQTAREAILPNIVSSTNVQTVSVPIRNSLNPCAYMAWVIRYVDDTTQCGGASDHQDTNFPPRAASSIVIRPNWVNFQPWISYVLKDGGNRVLDQRGQDDWLNSICQGMSNYFPGSINTNIGVITFTAFPTVENHGLGHVTLTSFSAPALSIVVPPVANTENVGTAVRQIDTFYFERNLSHMSNGAIIRQYQVLD